MATHTTSGVKMSFSKDGNKFSKTLNGMNAEAIKDSETAKAFATSYKAIVDGELTGVNLVVTTPVDVG